LNESAIDGLLSSGDQDGFCQLHLSQQIPRVEPRRIHLCTNK
jgi:hypothetical protein